MNNTHKEPLAPTRPRKRKYAKPCTNWTKEEDDFLFQCVTLTDEVDWDKITAWFAGKTGGQLESRWSKELDPKLVKGSWTREEDETIIELVKKHGKHSWALIAASLPGRVSKQVRERWHNHLNPSVLKAPFTPEEDQIIIREHARIGNKWSLIAQMLPGRTDNAVKNRWNSTIVRRFSKEELSKGSTTTEKSSNPEPNSNRSVALSQSAPERSADVRVWGQIPRESVEASFEFEIEPNADNWSCFFANF